MLNRFIAQVVSVMPQRLIWIFSKRYIAGKFLNDAIQVSKQLNKKNISVTIDVLGEYIKDLEEAKQNTLAFLETLEAISANDIKGTISIKPTMFGLLIDKDFCVGQIVKIIEKAKSLDIAVCIDMEDSSCTDTELSIFKYLYQQYPQNVSFVMQAYLYRTPDDLKELNKVNSKDHPIDIRLCKGIYNEKEDVAFQKKEEVNNNYIGCLKYMVENNFYCSIATHDKELVSGAEKIIKENSLSKDRYEFQMLYGVSPELRKTLNQKNHPLRVYVPYGEQWFGYSTRRLKENPKMVSHIIKSLFIRN